LDCVGCWLLAAGRCSYYEIAYKTQNLSHAEGISLAITNTFPLTLSAAIVIAMTLNSTPEIYSTG
jgi:hypothetical protein